MEKARLLSIGLIIQRVFKTKTVVGLLGLSKTTINQIINFFHITVRRTVAQFCKKLGIKYHTNLKRYHKGTLPNFFDVTGY